MYLALYRKYRPRTFDDVISQEHITTTLKNQIKNGSAAHAYLFTGSRGTGKTTCAKIFAAAVNCLDPRDGNPCLQCESCKEILSGAATDIVEMDAASNRGVDDVRQLRDEVSYSPVSCKFRVYIIDEVHMLTPEAFNALLKTLEEPPEHVKFILATTELHKVPATIVSRCQRFEFRRVDAAQSAKRLLEVAKKEGAQLDEDAALLISRLSDGGMRDALSILDRCVSADKHVTGELVRNCAGVADNRYLSDFSRMIAAGDTGGCIRLLSELYKNSKDMAVVVDELSGHFRDLMLCKSAPDDLSLLSCLPSEYENVQKSAEAFTLGEILRCLTILRECADGMGKTRQRKTFAEMCFVKMCTGVSAETKERRVTKREEYRVIEPQKEEFIPTPPEKMSRANLMNLNKMREVAKEAMMLNSTADETALGPEKDVSAGEKPAVEQPSAVEAPPVVEAPFALEAPIAVEQPPISEEPPIFGGPPAVEECAENEPENGNVSEISADGEVSKSEQRGGNKSFSEEEWLGIINKCDLLSQTLLMNSSAELLDNTLIVRTSKPLLLNNAKKDEITELQSNISDALGFPIILKLEKDMSKYKDTKELSEVEKLLKKAEDLGIEIRIS